MIHIICEAEQIYCEWTKAIGKTSGKKIDHSLCEINYYIREPHKIDRNTCCYHFMQFMCVHVLVELERMTEWEVAVEYIMCAPLCIRCMSTLACLADVHKYTHPRARTHSSAKAWKFASKTICILDGNAMCSPNWMQWKKCSKIQSNIQFWMNENAATKRPNKHFPLFAFRLFLPLIALVN